MAAAAKLEGLAPGFLARVRAASLRLAHRDGAVVTVHTALADVEDTYALDLEVPTLSRLRLGRLLKKTVTKLVGFYLRYLTVQVAAFSAAVNRFAIVLVERTDQLEARTAVLRRDLDRLDERVGRLEGAPAAAPAPEDGDAPA